MPRPLPPALIKLRIMIKLRFGRTRPQVRWVLRNMPGGALSLPAPRHTEVTPRRLRAFKSFAGLSRSILHGADMQRPPREAESPAKSPQPAEAVAYGGYPLRHPLRQSCARTRFAACARATIRAGCEVSRVHAFPLRSGRAPVHGSPAPAGHSGHGISSTSARSRAFSSGSMGGLLTGWQVSAGRTLRRGPVRRWHLARARWRQVRSACGRRSRAVLGRCRFLRRCSGRHGTG